jgi:hypothetical protein
MYSTSIANTSTFQNINTMNNEFRASYQVSGNYMIWYDYAIIRCKDIFDSFSSIPITKRFNGYVRLFLNTGAFGIQVNGNTSSASMFSGSSCTFTNTCPLMYNNYTPTLGTAPVCYVGGCFVNRPPSTNIFGINLSNSGASHPLTSCRIYYPQITIKESLAQEYISLNRAKTLKWTNFYFNQFSNISTGSSFSQLVLSGVSKIRGMWIVPYIDNTVNGLLNVGTVVTSITPFSPLLSPFDSAPATTGPLSLTNLNVAVGGVNVLQNNLFYTFQQFLENVSLYEKINAGDLGLSCGLISQQDWDQGRRFYYIDCSRGNIADNLTPRNVVVSFNNNNNVTISVMIFTEYYVEASIDVLTSEFKIGI